MSKKQICIFSLIVCLHLSGYSQVGIDKKTGFGASSILEFGTQIRGLVLRPTGNVNNFSGLVAGTVAFDGASRSFRYYGGSTPAWSTVILGGTGADSLTTADTKSQGTIMGASTITTTVSGALIFGKDVGETKAFVLPNVSYPELNMGVTPPNGLMVYDPVENRIKVYNGVTWTRF